MAGRASIAPDFISASRDFLFKFLSFILSKKTSKLLNFPPCFLSWVIEEATPSPKFFMVVRPKRILYFHLEVELPSCSGITLNWEKLSFTDGGKTSTAILLHSFTITQIVSTSPLSAVSTADI